MLKNKVAIVSAAGRGIGRGIALALSAAGAKVAVNSYSEDTTASTVKAIEDQGGEAFGFPADITAGESMLSLVETTLERFGNIDILVNNVGAGPKNMLKPEPGPLGPVALMWDAMYQQNLRPAVLMCEAVMPHFKAQKSGKIINISSIAGKASFSPAMQADFVPPAYSAMKAGLVNYTQCLADSLGPYNINVNAVCPGIVYTDAWAGNAERAVQNIPQFKGQDPKQWFDGIARGEYPDIFDRTPLGRDQTVEDMGNAVVFMVSDNALNITGQSLMVDGGMVKV